MRSFGKQLKELRQEKGLTQIQLAKVLHTDKSTIAKYETDKIDPSISMLNYIADFFKVSTDFLLGRLD